MNDSTIEFLNKLVGSVGAVVVMFLIAVSVLGIKACVVNERNMHAACMEAGGKVLFTSCVTIEQVPTENWRK